MALINDSAYSFLALAATMPERDPYTWDSLPFDINEKNTEKGPTIGGWYNAAYMYFNDANKDAGVPRKAEQWYGARITKAVLEIARRYGPHVNSGYAGEVYPVTVHVNPTQTWWAILSDKIGARRIATIPAPATGRLYPPSTQSQTQVTVWETGSDFDVFRQIVENGIVVRASIGGAVEINKVTVYGMYNGISCYLTVYFSSVKPTIENPHPAGGYINPRTGGRLTWEVGFDSTDVYGVVEQAYAIVQTRTSAEAQVEEHRIEGAQLYYAFDAEELTEAFDWRVQVGTKFDEVSDWSEWAHVDIVDSASTPVCLAPVNQIIEGGNGIREFEWRHEIATGTEPTGWELQYSVNRIDWSDLAAGESGALSARVDISAIPAGTVYWRVRTANADGAYGSWSEPAMLVVRDAPSMPVVTVTGNTMPVVKWQSFGQQGYEVMIDGNSSGVRYGADKAYTWDCLLEDGEHVVKVRTINQFGLYSPWAVATHRVYNVPSQIIPSIQAITTDHLTVAVYWSGELDTRAQIYRDGEMLVETDAKGRWIDNTATDRHRYYVRCVDAEGNYTDSEPITIALDMHTAAISVFNEWDWVKLLYCDGNTPVRDTASAAVYALNHYSGRVLPVAEIGSQRTTAHDVEYALFDARDAAKVRAMLGKIVCYKRRGEILIGLLTTISETRTEFSFNEKLHIEEVSL